MFPIRLLAAILLVPAFLAAPSRAQCTEWKPGFHWPGIDGTVHCVTRFDDGSGHGVETYVGGDVRYADGLPAGYIAKWNGVRWESVGGGRSAIVTAMCVFDDGTGPALYAAVNQPAHIPGSPTIEQISRWNGTSWSELPGGVYLRGVEAMVVHDDGSGPALYVAGGFPAATAPDVYMRNIARFNGTSWSAVGTQSPGAPSGGVILALASFDDGTGPALYAGGSFVNADGNPAQNFARWDGASWTQVGGGVGQAANSQVTSLAVWRDGPGTKLAVGGSFVDAGGIPARCLALWDGSAWSTTGAGTDYRIAALAVLQSGAEEHLVAGGDFTSIDGVSAQRVARYDGASWSPVSGGVNNAVFELHGFVDGSGPGLLVGGGFEVFQHPAARGIAEWRPATATWSVLGSGDGAQSNVYALRGFDDGSGPALYAGGIFQALGEQPIAYVGRWDGTSWQPVGAEFRSGNPSVSVSVKAFEVFDDGTGPALYAAGRFDTSGATVVNSIARWDGAAWQPLGSGIDMTASTPADGVTCLRVFDDGTGPALYAGGLFNDASGSGARNIARWDGASWSTVGSTLNGGVSDLEVYDDGAGARLIVAGSFNASGTTPLRRIARLIGSQWTAMGSGAMGGPILDVCAFDDGSGNGTELYAGGTFSVIGSLSVIGIAKWNGSDWVSVGTGTSGIPAGGAFEFAAFDDGTGAGAQLYAGGAFSQMDGVLAFSIARWNGTQWSAVDNGTGGGVQALTTLDLGDGTGPNLYAGGVFQVAGVYTSRNVARFGRTNAGGCPNTTGEAYCSGDGTATACPCGNSGQPGRGCENSRTTGGALLVAEGQAHVGGDTIRLVASGLPLSAMTLFIQGTRSLNSGAGSTFGDGLRCIGGSVTRLRLRQASSGVAQLGEGLAGDPEISVLGHIPPGSETRHYQAWYRDPAPAFCTSSTFNLTNAVRIRWVP